MTTWRQVAVGLSATAAWIELADSSGHCDQSRRVENVVRTTVVDCKDGWDVAEDYERAWKGGG